MAETVRHNAYDAEIPRAMHNDIEALRDRTTRLEAENRELRAKLETARAETLEEAARAGYVACAETRHVSLGDKVAATIRSLKDKDQQNG